MNNFRFNLKGQLNEVKLPEYKALWPLFETIVNSIQSIEAVSYTHLTLPTT